MKRCSTSGLRDTEIKIPKIPFYTHSTGRDKKKSAYTKCWQECGASGRPTFCCWWSANSYNHFRKSLVTTTKVGHLFTLWPSKIPPLSSYPRKPLAYVQQETCTEMFRAVHAWRQNWKRAGTHQRKMRCINCDLPTPWNIIQYSRQMNQMTCNTMDKL